ncbi:MAG: cation diffusion facilitator family transporter [Bdellovibrionota bacterium]
MGGLAKINQQKRFRAASLALAATTVLTIAKLVVAVATGSVGVLSEAIHSGLDLLSSLVTFFVVRASVRPADWDHPFGHGKIESLSALFEAFLLLVAGGYILFEGISKWTRPGHHVDHIGWGLAVTGASVLINLYVYFQNRNVAREQESIAIETNAFHFLTDVFSSLAVFLSLGALHFTQWIFLDPLVAILIAGYILWVGIEQIKKCVAELSDTVLPGEEVETVRQVLRGHEKEFLNYHDLRTRKAGAVRFVDLHLTVCSEQTVHEAHEVCDRIEDDLTKSFKEAHVNIHIEPCGNHGPNCLDHCRFYGVPRKQGQNG